MFDLDHVHIVCEDLEAMGAFLQTTIGATELRRNEPIRNWEYQLGATRIFVRQRRPGEVLAAGDIRRAGVDHLGLRVPDMTLSLAHLVQAGCAVVEPPKELRENLTIAFVTGPEGLLIELLQRD